jgi:hypothetical protein
LARQSAFDAQHPEVHTPFWQQSPAPQSESAQQATALQVPPQHFSPAPHCALVVHGHALVEHVCVVVSQHWSARQSALVQHVPGMQVGGPLWAPPPVAVAPPTPGAAPEPVCPLELMAPAPEPETPLPLVPPDLQAAGEATTRNSASATRTGDRGRVERYACTLDRRYGR